MYLCTYVRVSLFAQLLTHLSLTQLLWWNIAIQVHAKAPLRRILEPDENLPLLIQLVGTYLPTYARERR